MTVLFVIGFMVTWLSVGLTVARVNLTLFLRFLADDMSIAENRERHVRSCSNIPSHRADYETVNGCQRSGVENGSMAALLVWPAFIIFWVACAVIHFAEWVMKKPTAHEKKEERQQKEQEEYEKAARLLNDKGIEV